VHGLDEEVRLAGGVRWLSAAHGQGVWKRQRSAQSTIVTVTTMTGHLSTVTVFDCSARERSLYPMARSRSLRCSPGSRRLRRMRRNDHVGELALVSTRLVGFSCRSATRHRWRGSRLIAAYFVVTRGRKTVHSFLLSTAARDPDTVAGCGALPTIEPARGVPSGR
jgi:hypothetical protein